VLQFSYFLYEFFFTLVFHWFFLSFLFVTLVILSCFLRMPGHYIFKVVFFISGFSQAVFSFIDKLLSCFEEFPFRIARDVANHCA
jgi:hypothetical protein